jgi:Protein of unknown function (DUF4230)
MKEGRRVSFLRLVGAIIVSIVVLVPLAMVVAGLNTPPPGPPLPPLAIVRGMSELVTLLIHLSTSIEGGNNHWETKYLIHGESLLGVDLSQVEYRDVDPVKRRAVLRLPLPHLVMSKVDHNRSEEMYMRSKVLFPCDPQVVRAEVYKAADAKLERLAQDAAYVKQAKQQTQVVLKELFQGVEWNVRLEWIDDDAKAKDGQPSGDCGKVAGQRDVPAGNAAIEMTTTVGERPLPTP